MAIPELIPERRAVSNSSPVIAHSAMPMTTTLTAVPHGTGVSIHRENARSGICPSDHQIGMASTLKVVALAG